MRTRLLRTHFVNNILKLHHGHANKSVFSNKTEILHANVQLERIQLFFISDDAKIQTIQ